MKEPAVYDANIGNIQFPELCTDATTAADKVTCYSNSAGFLTLLAPSHNARTPSMTIAGGGYTNTFGGTSAAAPYTAGAIAALMSVDPKSNRPPAEYAQILRERQADPRWQVGVHDAAHRSRRGVQNAHGTDADGHTQYGKRERYVRRLGRRSRVDQLGDRADLSRFPGHVRCVQALGDAGGCRFAHDVVGG
jgi:subtilisin family serine protease